MSLVILFLKLSSLSELVVNKLDRLSHKGFCRLWFVYIKKYLWNQGVSIWCTIFQKRQWLLALFQVSMLEVFEALVINELLVRIVIGQLIVKELLDCFNVTTLLSAHAILTWFLHRLTWSCILIFFEILSLDIFSKIYFRYNWLSSFFDSETRLTKFRIMQLCWGLRFLGARVIWTWVYKTKMLLGLILTLFHLRRHRCKQLISFLHIWSKRWSRSEIWIFLKQQSVTVNPLFLLNFLDLDKRERSFDETFVWSLTPIISQCIPVNSNILNLSWCW